ncbi:centromere protein M [Ammospiza nelsoni]|uniref:centromere protein M n=1 Tax=Ammospiza caudacuta TaxID=2857398 RepID=UPI0027382F7B|nr:centromere protein M [Ammospiza caudacuta]XP_059328500.1 centromere protein M [Ammospiza nelsoni]
MAVLRPFDKLPQLNSGVLLLVGSDEALQRQLAEAILQEKKDFNISIHLATSLPLPSERDHLRPRIDLVVFMIDIKSKYSLKNVETSLAYVDASFFLGKVCFLVTGVGRVNACSIETNAVCKLGETYCSPVLFCELELEGVRAATAQRLVRMLRICAGLLPGVSALSFVSLMRKSDDD